MYDLGDACENAGLKHQARGLFSKVCASDSNFKDIKDRINTLKKLSGNRRGIPEAVMVADICESSRMMDLYGDRATYIIKNALKDIMFPILRRISHPLLRVPAMDFWSVSPIQRVRWIRQSRSWRE